MIYAVCKAKLPHYVAVSKYVAYMYYYKGQLFDIGNTVQVLTAILLQLFSKV